MTEALRVPTPAVEPSVSAIVVHYRGRDQLRACLAAVLAQPEVLEAIVVDNEGIADELRWAHLDPRVRVLAMPRNAGFGRAANAGLTVARGDAALVLNQDAFLAEGAVAELLRAAKDAGAWIAGPALVDETQAPVPAKDRFPAPLTWNGQASGDGWRTVPWVTGAAMLLAPGHTGLRFDRRFFMYVEDEELCWRAWRDGGRVILAERARAEHVGGTASGSRWSLGAIARRTVANRARMVAMHAGPLALAPFARDVMARRLRRR